jgi:hypothetical protein
MDELDVLDPRRADMRIEAAIARAEFAQQAINRDTAELWGACAEVLDEARRAPHLFVDPQVPMRDDEREEFAARAAVADLAVRLHLSESAVRAGAFDAETLRTRLPRLWAAFWDGELHPVNARAAADLVRSLPDGVAASAGFDEALVAIVDLAPGRFRARARVIRERIHSIPLAERVEAAAQTRGVWIEDDVDGMAYLTMKLRADVAHRAFARIDSAARVLVSADDESRTLAQLRADAAGDLLVDAILDGGRVPRVAVAVTVPVMTLLGHDDEPGTLEGYGPIDAETARRLAAHAPSFTRLLTHPVTGVLLDVDRGVYRPPADLKRWLQIIDVTCAFPGCTRSARGSDIDHILDRQFDGKTRAGNLVHLCRHHHRLKHMTRWTVKAAYRAPGSRAPGSRADGSPAAGPRVEWSSPTGHTQAQDAPPF